MPALALLALMAVTPKVPVQPVQEQPQAAAPAIPGPISGGYAPLNPTSPELQKPLRAALAAIAPVQQRSRAKIIAAHRQVVAGTNYRMTLQLRDGSRWQAVVWHRLDRKYQVVETTRLD